MIKNIIKENRGFVILFAVTLAAILLSIALGVSNIALKEVKFGTSVKDTNNALFAADTGAECAFFWDNPPNDSFPYPGSETTINCVGYDRTVNYTSGSGAGTYSFSITRLGKNEQSCAIVTVLKDTLSDPPNNYALITSKGYNNQGSDPDSCAPTENSVERELLTEYYY